MLHFLFRIFLEKSEIKNQTTLSQQIRTGPFFIFFNAESGGRRGAEVIKKAFYR